MSAPKKSCGSAMGDIISSVSYKYQTKDCVFNGKSACCELSFDGSKHNLAIALGNSSGYKALKEYGLPRTLTHIIKYLPELHEFEEFHKIGQILILHSNNLLIRITNASEEAETIIMQVEMQSVLNELENQDSKTHAKLVQERITSEMQEMANYWVHVASQPVSQHVKQVLTAVSLGLVAGAVTYWALR